MKPVVALAVALSVAGAAAARELQITVYNSDLGLVRDVREIEPPAGGGEVSVADVAARIDPTSVHLQSLTREGGITVLEQNYRFDLASPDRILERYLDGMVQAVLKDGGVREGMLLSFTDQQIVLGGEAGLSILQRAQLVDVRCPNLPDGLITRPSLVWDIGVDRGGPQRVELSYLTGGISWHAEYVAVVNDTDTGADLDGWVSVDNRSGATYPEARLQLIAGDVNRVKPRIRHVVLGQDGHYRGGRGGEVGFQEESFFEYHLYTLPRPTTIRDRETKQIALFPPASTPVTKIYEFRPWTDEKHIRTVLEFVNSEARGLGMPLPKGKVRTYKRDSKGGQQFIGEDSVDHTPKDEKVQLFLGNAFDIVPERTVQDRNRISDRVWEQTTEVKFRNHKKEKVTIVARDRFAGDWTIVATSLPSRKQDATTAEWLVEVDPNGETVLTYRVRVSR
jgi:hypothetical protein